MPDKATVATIGQSQGNAMAADGLILNERLKLGAAALNALATASTTVGVLTPAAAFLYGLGAPAAPGWSLVLGAGIWVSFAALLNYDADRLLGRLRLGFLARPTCSSLHPSSWVPVDCGSTGSPIA